MPVHNSDVADILDRVADLLDIQGANQFRVRAYRTASRTISGLSKSISEMVENGEELNKLPGIGKDLAVKIREIVETGTLRQLEEIEKTVPAELADLMDIGGLGPKRVGQLHKKLHIETLKGLEKAAREGKISTVKGFGKKTEENILDEIGRIQKGEGAGRLKLVVAEEITKPLLEYLRDIKGVKIAEAAGSYRRKKETVGDLDILVVCSEGERVMDEFVDYEDVDRVLSKGSTRSSIVLRSEFQVDLRVVEEESYGAALHYFTGSKEHNVAVRKLGQKRKLKINEYGVFNGEKRVAGRSEEELYEQVELPYIEPELRENRGEIEAAQEGALPDLVTLDDIRGDLQSHTKYSDGNYTLKEMAEAAQERGYEYLAVTDHSRRVTMARGLDERRLREQIDKIEGINEKLKGFRLLKSIEVDILEDGSLDLPDSVLKELDLVVFSIHYNTNLSRKKQTKRVLRAMENRSVNIFSHPTGRIIGKREPYDIDIAKVMKEALDSGCFMEVNAQPERLDLNDVYCKRARDIGLKLAISTDAHNITDLDFMKWGVAQARRGWLGPDDVLNTRSWKELEKLLKRK